MRRKLSVLRASNRILKSGARTAFLVIEPGAGLEPRLRRRAARVGPAAVSVRTSYAGMLNTARFSEITEQDLTRTFRETQLDWIDAYDAHENELRKTIGSDVFDERQAGRHQVVKAIDDNTLRRTLYTAVRR